MPFPSVIESFWFHRHVPSADIECDIVWIKYEVIRGAIFGSPRGWHDALSHVVSHFNIALVYLSIPIGLIRLSLLRDLIFRLAKVYYYLPASCSGKVEIPTWPVNPGVYLIFL